MILKRHVQVVFITVIFPLVYGNGTCPDITNFNSTVLQYIHTYIHTYIQIYLNTENHQCYKIHKKYLQNFKKLFYLIAVWESN